jgi:hypothetical protein
LGWRYLMDFLSTLSNIQFALQNAPKFVVWLTSVQGESLLGLAGSVMIVLAFFAGEKRQEPPVIPPTPTRVTASPPVPNIVYCGWNAHPVNARDHYISQEPNGKDHALTIDFRNQPLDSGPVGDAEVVQAELIYYLSSGSVYLKIDHATWLGEDYNSVRMDGNSKRSVIFLVQKNGERDLSAVEDERESLQRRPPLIYNSVIKANTAYTIELYLTVDGIRWGPYKYAVTLQPEFDFKPI